jgi:hypothetical protein
MTDDYETKLEELRAQIRTLETQLDQRAGRDSRRSEVMTALLKAGCSTAALPDAVQVFESTATLRDDGWSLGGLFRASIDKVATRFLDARPHLRGNADGGNAVNVATAPGFVPPRYADGSPVPQSEWTSDELFEAAGGWPDKQPPRLDPVKPSDFSQGVTLEAIPADSSAAYVAALNTAVRSEGKPKTYSVAELDGMTSDELWQAAGPFPRS